MEKLKIILLLSLITNILSGQVQKTGIWDIFEDTIYNSKLYEDPYRDVELNVTWTSPEGEMISFYGFWDGDSTWLFRFMPFERGRWKYHAEFSDGTGIKTGEIRCTASDIKGIMVPDLINANWFGYSTGKHAQVRALHIGDCFFAENWDDPEVNSDDNKRTVFLDWANKQGYNLFSIASHYLNRKVKGRGLDWDTPDLWPLDYKEYQKMETVLFDLKERDIYVYPFAGFFGKNSDFPTDHDEQKRYIKYTLARIAPFYNLIFNVAGPEPMKSGIDGGKKYQFSMDTANIGRLGNLISEYDPFGHMLTVHNKDDGTIHRKSQWLTYQTLQGGKGTNLENVHKFIRKRHEPGKPTFAQEVFWPGNKWHNGGNSFTDDEIRQKGITLIMSQTTICYADMNGNSSTGFSGQPEMERLHQKWHDIMHNIWDFFDKTEYYTMNPANDLISNGFCLADPGNEYLVYLPQGGSVNVKLENHLPFKIEWYDAKKLDKSVDGGVTLTGKNLVPPSEGEWMLHLYLDAQKLSFASGNFPDVAMDSKGKLHVVYNRDGLKYRFYDPKQHMWSEEENPGCNCTNVKRSDPDIVIDSEDNPHVFCGTEYARRQNGQWQKMATICIRDTEMAIDRQDNIYIIDRKGNQDGNIGMVKIGNHDTEWQIMSDPDHAHVGNESDHVYPDMAVNQKDNSIHIVQRHGPVVEVTYRKSTDGGLSWNIVEAISDDRHEGPHIVIDHEDSIYVTTGHARFFVRQSQDNWKDEGKVLNIHSRYQPELTVDKDNNIYCTSFEGRFNIRKNGQWIGEQLISKVSRFETIGFTEAVGMNDFVYVIWEEGNGTANKGLNQNAMLFLAKIYSDGRVDYLFNE